MKNRLMYVFTLLILAYLARLYTYEVNKEPRYYCCCCCNNNNVENSGVVTEFKKETEQYIVAYNSTEITESPYNDQSEQYADWTTKKPKETDPLDIPDITGPIGVPDITGPIDITNRIEQSSGEITDITETTVSADPPDSTDSPDSTVNNEINTPTIRNPYTVDEIINIFTEDREAFDKIKTVCVNTDYSADIYAVGISLDGKREIFYKDATTGKYIDISELYEHEIITNLFNKYNIFSVGSYNYDDHYTHKKEKGVIFQMLSTNAYEQWILYSETQEFTDTDGVADDQSGEIVKLDNYWYYRRVDY